MVVNSLNLKPYEEMNSLEVITWWTRLKAKAPHGLSIFKSPNENLWAIVDESHFRTIKMWDIHSGQVYKESIDETEQEKEETLKEMIQKVEETAI
jgi:hypothetical protein